jgi:hypothetical protein
MAGTDLLTPWGPPHLAVSRGHRARWATPARGTRRFIRQAHHAGHPVPLVTWPARQPQPGAHPSRPLNAHPISIAPLAVAVTAQVSGSWPPRCFDLERTQDLQGAGPAAHWGRTTRTDWPAPQAWPLAWQHRVQQHVPSSLHCRQPRGPQAGHSCGPTRAPAVPGAAAQAGPVRYGRPHPAGAVDQATGLAAPGAAARAQLVALQGPQAARPATHAHPPGAGQASNQRPAAFTLVPFMPNWPRE